MNKNRLDRTLAIYFKDGCLISSFMRGNNLFATPFQANVLSINVLSLNIPYILTVFIYNRTFKAQLTMKKKKGKVYLYSCSN